MKNSFVLFGKTIPLYGVCFYGGIALAVLFGFLLAKKKKVDLFNFLCCVVYTMIGAMIGAKLLFILVSLREIIQLKLNIIEVIKGGFVFYGGLLGGALGIWIYAKQFREPVRGYVDIFATVLPLGHAFGRVGCFFAGCCYGMEYDGCCSVVYETSTTLFTPLGVPLLPIQLIEAVCLIVVFAVLIILFFKNKQHDGKIALIYALSYAVLRFILEFFRGDKDRGVFLLSTSQYISLAIVAVVIFLLIRRKKRA